MKRKRLNGWQRLWVIAVVIWLPVVVIQAQRTFPTAEEYRTTWKRFAEAEAPATLAKPWELYACRDERVKAGQDEFKAFLQCEKDGATPNAQDRKRRYDEVIAKGEAAITADLPKAQAMHAGYVLAAWIIPAALLYGLGLLIGWVRRGFQQPAQTD